MLIYEYVTAEWEQPGFFTDALINIMKHNRPKLKSIIQRPTTFQRRTAATISRTAAHIPRTIKPGHLPALIPRHIKFSRIPTLISRTHKDKLVTALIPRSFRPRRSFNPELTIVVPVMNEADNIPTLVERIHAAIGTLRAEVLFVDDSHDMDSVNAANQACTEHQTRTFDVRIYHRLGAQRWGGLSGAVADGMRTAKSDRVLVMDGDLQHPPETIPSMLEQADSNDIVIASRYCAGGSSKGLSGLMRHMVSRTSTVTAKVFFPGRLKGVSDPMTGFFMFDRRKIDRSRLRPKGFKILLEILASHPELSRTEVPLQFASRNAGESHGSLKQGLEFVTQLLDLRFGVLARRFTSLPKFVQFGSIGGSVFVAGMALLYGLVEVAGLAPLVANAIQLAVTFWLNYTLNKHITWRERDISRSAAYKFLVSRATTTFINYILFAWLISLQFAFTLLGTEFAFTVHYLAANVIALVVIMALNYEISDRWAFAEPKSKENKRIRRLSLHGEYKPGTSIAVSLTLVLAAVIGVTLYWTPANILPMILVASSLGLFLQASIEVWRMAYSYRAPESVDKLRFPEPLEYGPREKFCLIVPARHESDVLAHTLKLLTEQTHPNVDIISIICDDDEDTLAVARQAAEDEPRIRVMAFPMKPGVKPSKPLQLNYAFEQTSGYNYSIVGIIDAEDTVHPELLKHIEAAFSDKDIDVVQGGVQLMNHDSSWYSLHNVLEYYRWFNSAMAFQADRKFMPLGGNTIFVRASLLRKAGGWPVTLTEDCSLGVLLSTRFKAKTAVYYDPRLATREETPDSLTGLFKQRVRWNQGFFHEWKSGIWLELPTLRQRLLAGYVLIGPVLLAVINIFMVISLLAIFFLKAPVGLAMLMYLPFVPVILLSILIGVFLHDFGKAFERKIKYRHYALLFATQFFYQIVLNTAALWAVVRELRGDDSWFKTPHSGLHRKELGVPTKSLQPAYAMATVPVSYQSMEPEVESRGVAPTPTRRKAKKNSRKHKHGNK